ncbi:MAG: SpoIIE family protein phosphatase [Actinobacteria bacterium]|nr:SpoIIE family protein phosphatase [Actinomycetota bacterium]
MSNRTPKLLEEYKSALQDYLSGSEEASLQRVYEIGRKAIAGGLGVLDMAAIHREALATLLFLTPEESTRIVEAASVLLSESLSPFEMTHRGFREANAELRRLAETLEQRVEERTEELRQAEEKYRSIFEHVVEGISQIATDGRLITINPAFARIYGYDSVEEMTKAVTNRMQLYVEPKCHEEFVHLIEEQNAVLEFECQVYRKDGSVIWVRESARAIRDASGRLLGYESTTIDVTERKRAGELSDALNNINAAISSTLDFEEIMRRVVVESGKAIRSETAGIGLRKDGRWVIKYIHGLPPELSEARFTDEEAPITALAVRAKKPIVINDAYNDQRVKREVMMMYGIRSALAIPLVVKGEIIGVLLFDYRSAPIPFAKAEIDFANKLALAVSLALQNARLYEVEHRIAEILQENLIRPVPKIPGMEIGVAYESTVEAERAGGDFFDIFELEGDLVAVLIGDVAGKGVEAAGLTETIRSSVRTLAYVEPSPSLVFGQTNRSLLRQLPSGQFATAALLIINKGTGEARFTNAGHPPAVICKNDCSFLKAPQGLPLGAFTYVYEESCFKLDEEESMVLYTDGLTEARRGSEFFGDLRLLKVLSTIESRDPHEMVEGLLRSTVDFAEGRLRDDIAIVALRLSGRR